MENNIQKTEAEVRNEKVIAKQALKFGTVEIGSVAFWHMMGAAEAKV